MHIVWIQSRNDIKNQWLQLWYCVKEEGIEMAIKDWHKDWRIPDLNQEMPVDKEVDAQQEQTPTRDKIVPKKPKTGQNSTQQKKGGVSKKGTQARKKKNTQVSQEQKKEIETAHGTTSSATQQEQGQTKMPIIQTGVVPLEYMITEDDADLVAQMVQDQTAEDFDEAQRQRDRIQDELTNMRQLLEKIGET
jgi:hypothetical protein